MALVMHVVLTGTGSAAGVPVPGCGCARCRAVARSGDGRSPAGALVDGLLRLGGPAVEPVAGYAVTALRCGAVEVRGPAGSLLWAPGGLDPSSLPSYLPSGTTYDLVALGAPDGEVSSPAVGHVLAALRATGRTRPETVVVAVGIGHEAPAGGELHRRLSAWGVRAVEDGATIEASVSSGPPAGWRTLVLGGARSGKSAEAERLLAAEPRVSYVATAGEGAPGDDEWAARVQAHRDRRPAGWSTVETLDVRAALDAEPGALLVDCLSLWLTGVMAEAGVWTATRGADETVARAVDDLVAGWRGAPGRAVAVSSEVGSGVVPATSSGRRFRDELGRLNQRIAAESDEVLLVVAGRAVRIGEGR